ncbi:MAG: hypothetical protein V9E81_13105 [Marmoricola sp.]
MSELIHLCRGGVSVAIGSDDRGVPVMLHWGAALDSIDDLALALRPGISMSAFDHRRQRGLVGAAGFAGTPGVTGHRDGGGSMPLPRQWSTTSTACFRDLHRGRPGS